MKHCCWWCTVVWHQDISSDKAKDAFMNFQLGVLRVKKKKWQSNPDKYWHPIVTYIYVPYNCNLQTLSEWHRWQMDSLLTKGQKCVCMSWRHNETSQTLISWHGFLLLIVWYGLGRKKTTFWCCTGGVCGRQSSKIFSMNVLLQMPKSAFTDTSDETLLHIRERRCQMVH